jgi:threonine dehydratase
MRDTDPPSAGDRRAGKAPPMKRKFDNILQAIGRTPIVRLNRLAPSGCTLWVKIESFNPMGSVKDRLALGIIERAEQTGADHRVCRLAGYNQSISNRLINY